MHDSQTRRGLETIARNARAQAQLVEDLLDMNRIVSGKVRLDVQRIELVPIVEAAIDSVRPSADAKSIAVRRTIDPNAGPVFGDPNRLQQIVWNLLSNAAKFTPKGGKVDVLLQRVSSSIEITIHDTGIGISPELLPRLFERFRQADSSTTRKYGGLGLSIVKQLVELHGGSIAAESDGDGTGATFCVRLRCEPCATLPRQRDGYQFIGDVRNLSSPAGGKTPAIAFTAFARSEDRTRAMLAGYQVHVSKPIEWQELVATIKSLAGNSRDRDP